MTALTVSGITVPTPDAVYHPWRFAYLTATTHCVTAARTTTFPSQLVLIISFWITRLTTCAYVSFNVGSVRWPCNRYSGLHGQMNHCRRGCRLTAHGYTPRRYFAHCVRVGTRITLPSAQRYVWTPVRAVTTDIATPAGVPLLPARFSATRTLRFTGLTLCPAIHRRIQRIRPDAHATRCRDVARLPGSRGLRGYSLPRHARQRGLLRSYAYTCYATLAGPRIPRAA